SGSTPSWSVTTGCSPAAGRTTCRPSVRRSSAQPGGRPRDEAAMIGVYVHPRGRGHLHRVLPVAAELRVRGEEVTMLLTGRLDESLRRRDVRVVLLPVSAVPSPPGAVVPADGPTPGEIALAARGAAGAWIDRARPRAFWVDSSPAMSLAARMTGTPMVSTLP